MDMNDLSVFVMQWGPQPGSPAAIIDVARHAEALGFYSVTIPHVPLLPYAEERPPDGFVWKHIPPRFKDYQYDALVLLPMMAQATSRIRIGLNVAVAGWLHPFVWAKYLASVDAATGGRLIAGFGLGHAVAGGPTKALDNLGMDGHQRGRMSDEALELVTRLWTSDDVISFDGAFYKGVDLMVEPKPIQKPYPELWWAGKAEPSVRRAARYARLLETSWPAPSLVRDFYVPALAQENAKVGGRAEMAALMYTNVLPDGDLTPAELSRRYYDYKGETLDTLAVGSPERCAAVIRNMRAAGVRHFVLDFHRHGLDPVDVIRPQLDAFVTRVVPLLRSIP
jgi:alkanesulfonate monooxygenase SsuD/methylene tetrahydromethanopterin reductase-like flavin-dependent oxidoreductase (luciferase family)